MNWAADDDFDLDVGDPLLYVFDPGDGRAADALQRMDVGARPATTGSEIMAAASNGELRGVVVAPFGDEELRELFMVAFRGRFPDIPVVFISERASDPQVIADAKSEGAVAVLGWPLPADVRETLATYFGGEVAGHEAAPTTDAEKQVLLRKLGAMEHRDTLDLIPAQDLNQLVEQHEEERTSLRSELTLVRERSQLLQRRIERLTQDLASVTHQRDDLKRKLKKTASGGFPKPVLDPAAIHEKQLKIIKKVGANAENFVWGLEQTIRFMEELQFEAGDKKAPSLDAHVRILKLTRKLLTQLQKYSKDL